MGWLKARIRQVMGRKKEADGIVAMNGSGRKENARSGWTGKKRPPNGKPRGAAGTAADWTGPYPPR